MNGRVTWTVLTMSCQLRGSLFLFRSHSPSRAETRRPRNDFHTLLSCGWKVPWTLCCVLS